MKTLHRRPQFITDFALAWRLLTVIPLPLAPDEAADSPGRAAGYFPLVGLILGLALAGISHFLYAHLPGGLAAGLLIAVWAGLTGLLHLDGFMDCCDGLLPPRDPAHRLEIMKDSRVGAFGVVGAILLLLLKFNALAVLPAAGRLPILVLVPVLGRWAMTWAMARYPPARQEGLGVLFKAGLGWAQVSLASAVAVAIPLVLLGWGGILLLGVAWLITTLVARLALARISGLTGDVYGAICEITETTLLIIFAIQPWSH
ncbi:MAG: adenosylcobinamide-GDP ribazoletransferase [Anaerolineae bacterium]|nr:adenosylcobinamide-GDP ribazoletransferase [Anaerolineae bacterium]